MTRRRRTRAKGAIELIEEAVFLLRNSPARALAGYYMGAVPFVIGGLFFWTDMSRSPFAGQHLAGAALSLSLLFFWMKFWQAIFTSHLLAIVAGQKLPQLPIRRKLLIFIQQGALQATGLYVLPVAALLALPFGWVYAFYQNLTVLGHRKTSGMGPMVGKAAHQAGIWPLQNLYLVGIMSGFGLFVFLNLTTVSLALPGLVKMLLGVETVFSRSSLAMLNTTFFAVMAGLTYLCVDPIMKAIYTLRCFYGESRLSGADLEAELRQFVSTAASLSACIFAAMLLLAATRSNAAEDSGDAAPNAKTIAGVQRGTASTLSASELDDAIRRVIQQRKYAWRAEREQVKENEVTEDGLIARFLARIRSLLGGAARTVGHWIEDFLRWLFRGSFRKQEPSDFGYRWMMMLHFVLWLLLAAVLAGLAVLIFRIIRDRRQRRMLIASVPIQPVPDLADENVGAEQLSEDGWMKLGRDLLERGELRLALRAFYLASLAYLAERNLITLARFKSNRDYERELLRRGHAFPALLGLFGECISIFDRTWYGLHEISRDRVAEFAANIERIKLGGQA